MLFQNNWPIRDLHSFDWAYLETQYHRLGWEDHLFGVTPCWQHPTALSRCLSRPRDARVQTWGRPVCQAHFCVSISWDEDQVDSVAKRPNHHRRKEKELEVNDIVIIDKYIQWIVCFYLICNTVKHSYSELPGPIKFS